MNFYAFIPKLLNMSLTASVSVVFVLLLRLMLKKSTQGYLLRLVGGCPVPSALSGVH